MKITKRSKEAGATTVTLAVPADLLKKIDDWMSLNYRGISRREKAMLYLIEKAMAEVDGTSVDLDRG